MNNLRPTPHDTGHNLVIDLETSVKNRGDFAVGTMKASPYHPENKIVMYGSQIGNVIHAREDGNELLSSLTIATRLVGQNIKFDLLYLLTHHYSVLIRFLRTGGKIYDTQLAEYLLTGQEDKMMPLGSSWKIDDKGNKVLSKEGLARRYGGTEKDDRIKEFWNAGTDTEDIPKDMLSEYLLDDVENTGIVYLHQMKLIDNLELNALVDQSMEALLLTTFMEWHGMHFDLDQAANDATPLEIEQTDLIQDLKQQMAKRISDQTGKYPLLTDLNPLSNKQVSLYLFGGTYDIVVDVEQLDPDTGEVILYKSGLKKGKPKTKKMKIGYDMTGMASTFLDIEKKSHGWDTSNEVLQILKSDKYVKDFVVPLLRLREVSKDLNTYYKGLVSLTWLTDNCIHGSINHTTTATGRTSSSNPNLQNITN